MKENEGKKEEFTETKIFAELPQDKWDELTRAVERRVVAPRTIIFRQGDPGDSFYVIRSGKVRVLRRDSDGFETELSVLGAGESFGEMALVTGESRSANVEAMEETHLMVLSKGQFDRILRDFPDISLTFVKQMSGWLMRADRTIETEAARRYQRFGGPGRGGLMNDSGYTVKKIFISHRSKDKDAAMKIDTLLKIAGGGNLKTFLSERIEPGAEWPEEVLGNLEEAQCLILLYTDPSEEWEWCLFEAGFFMGGGRGKRLICLHATDVTQPKPLQQWESVRVNDADEMGKFLRTLLKDLNPALVESKEDLYKLTELIAAAFLLTVRRKLEPEWNTKFVIINFKDKAQVKMLKDTGRVPNDVSCGEAERESLDVFGRRTGECTMETIQEGLNIHERSWWMKCLGHALRAAALKKYPIPPIPRIHSGYTEKEYDVVLHRIDRFSDDTLSFCLLFIESVPELVEEKDKQLRLSASMLRVGRLFRWKILTKYYRNVSILKEQKAGEEKINDCLEDLALSMEWIRGETERIDVVTPEDIVALFQGDDDKKAISKLLQELWPELFRRLSNAIEAKDLDEVLHTLNEMLELNKDFMIRFAGRYLELWKNVN